MKRTISLLLIILTLTLLFCSCGEGNAVQMGATTVATEASTVVPKPHDVWLSKNYVTDGTVVKIITTEEYLTGTFSNHSIDKELLRVEVIITKAGSVGFRLLQEGTYPVKNNGSSSSFEEYVISLYDTNDKNYTLAGVIQGGTDTVLMNVPSADTFMNVMKTQSGTIRMYFYKKSDFAFKFFFEIPISNFTAVLATMP